MSGGNQQKAIIAREIDKDPQLLVAVQPTRGLDVGAIEYIHKQLVAERDAGRAVLLVSLELDEVMNLSDRILVIYEGEIVGEFDPKTTTVQELGPVYGRRQKAEGGTRHEKAAQASSQNGALVGVLASLLSIVVGLILGFVLLVILKPDAALAGMNSMLTRGISSLNSFSQVLYQAAPLMMCGLSVGLCL